MVELSLEIDEALDYISSHKELVGKKIIITKKVPLVDTIITKIKKSNINYQYLYVTTYGNRYPVSFTNYCRTVEKIDEMIKDIMKYPFSPLERLFYVYDLLKERVYKEVDNLDLLDNARDLSKVLFGENIVCIGYTHLMNVLLSKMGYRILDCELDSLDDDYGHMRSYIYINDSKYNINGFYYFDSTWDSRKGINDIIYRYSYCYFAKTKKEIEVIDLEKRYVDIHFPIYFKGIVKEFVNQLKNGNVSQTVFRSINYMYYLLKGEALFYNNSEMNCKIENSKELKELEEFELLLNNPISNSTLIKALYHVFQMKKDTQFLKERIFCTMMYSNWCSEDGINTFKELFGYAKFIK